MPGTTDTQSLRFGTVDDVITHTMQANLADDIATQLNSADTARTAALTRATARVGRLSSTFTLPVSAVTVVTMDLLTWDTHGMVNLGTQPQRVTTTASSGAGLYHATVTAQVDTTGWTKGDLIINKNGGFYAQRTWWGPQNLDTLLHEAFVPLDAVSDYLTFALYHEGGGSTTVYSVEAWVQKVTGN